MSDKVKHYKFYSDPGHGWLAVKISEIQRLGIYDRISTCSYVNGGTMYLEEDCDAPLFMKTKKNFNEPFEVEEVYQEKTPIRNYRYFQGGKP